MDVIRRAYSATSDDDDDEEEDRRAVSGRRSCSPSAPKRLRSDGPSHWAEPTPASVPHPAPFQAAPPLPGRYVSKRERAISSASLSTPSPLPAIPMVVTRPGAGDITDPGLPCEVLESLRSRGELGKCSGRLLASLDGHTSAVNTLQWSQCHAHLLASAGMDQTVRVWNVWSKKEKLARIFSHHGAAVKDVKWSPLGPSLLSCGYDCTSRLVDLEKSVEMQEFKEDQNVMAIRFHPSNPEVFLSGGSKGSLRLWDVRTRKVVKEYLKSLGSILDIEFSRDGKHFISSSDVAGSNISENAIIFWDVSREVPLSNQIYTEAYTCPCIRYHPFDCNFVAQSNGNYVAIFSARPPFRLDRFKRYEEHTVSGFPIKCNFSCDGEELISGSADGCMYFYNYRSSELMRKIKAFDEACVDVALHPRMSNIIASCSWKGEISVFW